MIVGLLLVSVLLSSIYLVSQNPKTSQLNSINRHASSSTVEVASTLNTTSTTATTSADPAPYAGDWLTYHHDNSRAGSSGSITGIGAPYVAWKSQVDAAVYAEPLFYNGFVFIATENDSVYALNSTSGAIVWSNLLGTPANSLVSPYVCNGHGPNITPTIGITGTPVIDPASGTIYVAALIGNLGYELFALNTNTGEQRWNATITAPNFQYLPEEQRGALALANGYVYVPFGGYSWSCFDPGPTGWVIAMSTSGSGQKYSFNVPTKMEGDIWTPEGVSVDSSGNVYVVTGDSNNQTYDLGNSVIKLTPHLRWINSSNNYFSPTNWQYINTNDLDLGDTGATLLPENLIFAMGKVNMGYLLNASNLGGIGGQVYNGTVCGNLNSSWPYGAWGATSYFNNTIYVPCAGGLDALSLQSGADPTFESLWNYTGFFAGPPIIAGGVVWMVTIPDGTLFGLEPQNGAVLFHLTLSTVEHFTTPSAGGGFIFVAANRTVYAISPST